MKSHPEEKDSLVSAEQTAPASPAKLGRNLLFGAIPLTPSSVVSLLMLAFVMALVIVGPFLPSYDPYSQNLGARNLGIWTIGPEGVLHIFGTDALGRDLMSRLVLGGRMSLVISVAAVSVSLLIGTVLGVIAGYFGGATDSAIMGFADLQLAVPRILIVIAVVAVIGPSVPNLIVLLGATSWVIYGRVVRAMTLSLRTREFTLAAIVMGASSPWIIRKHVLPHTISQVIVMASFDLGNIIMLEAALSYLGLGVQPPVASWGRMINEAEAYISTNPNLVILPGVMIFLLVVSTNVLSQFFTDEGRAEAGVSGV